MRFIQLASMLCSSTHMIRAASAAKISSGEYLRAHCNHYKQHFEPLVTSQLDALPYEVTLLNILRQYPPDHLAKRRLSNETFGWPIFYVYDGELFWDK